MMLAALVAAAALSAAPASAATPPRDFVGVTAWEPMSSTELGRLAGSKARVYRVLILWQQVERGAPQGDCTVRCTHHYDWEYYDQMFRRAAARGVRIMPLLHGAPRCPELRADLPADHRLGQARVRGLRARGGQALRTPERVVAVLDARGDAPALLAGVKRAENTSDNWRPGPRPAAYATMLKGVSAAIKRAAPGVKVVAAGLPWPSTERRRTSTWAACSESRASRGRSTCSPSIPTASWPST